MIDIGKPSGYGELLSTLLKAPIDKVRGTEYRVTVPDTYFSEHKPDGFFAQLPGFNKYLAQARVEYIESQFGKDAIADAMVRWHNDHFCRQVVFYKPDWWWDGAREHVNCVLAYQPMCTGSGIDLHVFMRSSDLWNAFPFDWYAHNKALEYFRGIITLAAGGLDRSMSIEDLDAAIKDDGVFKLGKVYWHTSNLHIKQDDHAAVAEFVKQKRF